jgi:hypothetical protein
MAEAYTHRRPTRLRGATARIKGLAAAGATALIVTPVAADATRAEIDKCRRGMSALLHQLQVRGHAARFTTVGVNAEVDGELRFAILVTRVS